MSQLFSVQDTSLPNFPNLSFIFLNFEATGERIELMRAMREEGKTLQEIADALGFKSPSAVHYVLSK